MHEADHHEMQLQATYPSGAEEWLCPMCGRQFVVRWVPSYSMTVLNQGNIYACHTGGKGDLSIGTSETMETADATPVDGLLLPGDGAANDIGETDTAPLADELRPWLKWMREIGFYGEGDEAA